jgi:hypothetical protein
VKNLLKQKESEAAKGLSNQGDYTMQSGLFGDGKSGSNLEGIVGPDYLKKKQKNEIFDTGKRPIELPTGFNAETGDNNNSYSYSNSSSDLYNTDMYRTTELRDTILTSCKLAVRIDLYG